MAELKPCPVCKEIPTLSYCCGEWMVYCDDQGCPIGGSKFTEMHTNKELEIEAWNRRAGDGK